ncbi:CGNR zinc finger domain-containing protein [Streptomyces sp. ISL-10]|uniref:CGNR zinc finger domain-containing protein n=1 Tax=Streptomyces sp. ISL-10 TaxID=2819172 RepID=UPI001BEB6D7E|nr:ABATE domain-containing protein [Streptomyces sp. ISL-10]MBT2366945.1 CGNR zinc finger domain-containing protein [Streptomyces sp. ISL-10]
MVAGTGSYDWRFDSGRVCLDLVATAPQADRAGTCGEPLAGPGRLACWLVGAGLVPAGTRLGAVDAVWVAGFVELRQSIAQLVAAALEGRAAGPELETLNDLAEGPPPGIRAVRDENGTLVRALSTAPARDALLAAVARDAVDLLTDPVARSRLRRCEGDSCARVYLDTSRGRRRRWCSSEVCGNRERVARHRRRAAAHS